jgi:hypothetical protein
MLFSITMSALLAAFTSILPFFSFVSCHSFLFSHPSIRSSFSLVTRPACHPVISFILCPVLPAIPFCSLKPPSCHPFRGWPVKPAILPSLFYSFPLPRESFSLLATSILSSFFDGVPFILSSFSLVTHPAFTILSSLFYPFLSLFFVSHLSILSSLLPVNHSSCHSCLFPHPSILSSLSAAAAGLSVLSDCLVSIKI